MLYPTTCVGLRYGYPTGMLSGFSRKQDYRHSRLPPKGMPYFRISAQVVDLPATLITYVLQRAFPSARGSVTTASPQSLPMQVTEY